MKSHPNKLKREEILTLARRTKLMLVDGEHAYLNDRATEKNLIYFVRLIESKQASNDQFSEDD